MRAAPFIFALSTALLTPLATTGCKQPPARGSGEEGSDARESGESAAGEGDADGGGKAAAPTIAAAPLEFRPATNAKYSPFVEPGDDREAKIRARLEAVVRTHGLNPDNAWAIAHALIVFGPDAKLEDGRAAVDVMFERWAVAREMEGETLASFPNMQGRIPVQPHPGLMLKSVAEAGVDPAREITLVGGKKVTVGSLFRTAALQTYATETGVIPPVWNDTPWLLQGLATWAPDPFAWTAEGGHDTDLDALTHALALKLEADTKFLRDAMAAGTTVQKRKQGIFSYTCGGQHMIQGVAYAVARGYGAPGDAANMAGQLDALLFRIDLELGAVDSLITSAPQYKDKLLAQRLKFLGHTLETGHKMAALGLVELTEQRRAGLRRVRSELLTTVETIEAEGYYDDLDGVKARDYQLYLDLVGDAAHALRGLALADGSGTILL